MRSFIVALCCVLVGSVAQAANLAQPKGIGLPIARNMAFFSQEVTIDNKMAEFARVGPLANSSDGFGIDKNVVKYPALPVKGLPIINIAQPATQAEVLAASQQWLDAYLPAYRTRIGTWLKSQHLSAAFYNYSQEFMLKTDIGPVKKQIAFNMNIDGDARPAYGSPKIVDADPLILQAVYYPLKPMSGLPPEWKFPDAGLLKYRLLNKKLEPLTDWGSVDTAGAFDTGNLNGNVDDAAGCLMDRANAGCGTGPTDIKTLMGSTGATFGFVDYVQQLQPEYQTASDGSMMPKGAISVDARVWDCQNYVNKGNYGYVLDMGITRYTAQTNSDGISYAPFQRMSMRGISPTKAYQKQVAISALGGLNPSGVIISPVEGDSSLLSITSPDVAKMLIYVAPVTAQGSDGILSGASFAGDMAVREISASGGVHEYYIGTVGDNYWGSGNYDRTVTFNLADPKTLDEVAITQEGFDDWMLIAVNGTIVYIGPRGGDMLEPGQAPVSESNCSQIGSQWQCYYSWSPSYDWATRSYTTPPAGCTKVSSSWDTGDVYQCTGNTYRTCSTDIWNGGYQCSDSACGQWQVQYTSSGSCGNRELSTSWHFNNYINLSPYLQAGRNEIFMRVIVAGGGEGWFKLRTQTCGATLGLTISDPPPVPASGGQTGVSNTLNGM